MSQQELGKIPDKPYASPQEDFDSIQGEGISADLIPGIRHELGIDTPKTLLDHLSPVLLPENKPTEFTKGFEDAIALQPEGTPRRFRDVINLVRYLPGRSESTTEKQDAEEAKGHKESAKHGIGRRGKRKFVAFLSEMKYWAGTLGVSMGEQWVIATKLAVEREEPLVAIFSSAGARQQETTIGLMQMPVMSEAVRVFREESKMPFVGICNESWGGISASAASLGDVRVGIRGGAFGFAGPKVMDNFKGKRDSFARNRQSVEAALLDGNVDIVFNDLQETLAWTDAMLAFSELVKHPKTPRSTSIPGKNTVPGDYDRFPTGGKRIVNRIGRERQEGSTQAERVVFLEQKETDAVYEEGMDTYDQYQMLLRNPYRPDTDMLMQLCFDTVVPLYSSVVEDNKLHYPPIIAALASIDHQPYLVIGNQPSYYVGSDNRPRLIPAGPHAKDFRRRDEWLRMGKRLGLPLVSFVNTFGAYPTIEEEQAGLSQSIADATIAGQDYPHPVLTYVTGAFGSGGGIGSGPIGDVFKMLEGSHMYVAAPESSTVILYNPDDPTQIDVSLVKSTINTSRVTAKDQLELGIIDGIIKEPVGGGQKDPIGVANALRQDIIAGTIRASKMKPEDRAKAKTEKLLGLGHHHLQ